MLYGAPVGDAAQPLSYASTAHAMFPRRCPAEARAISLQMINSTWQDRHDDFWSTEEHNLKRQFDLKMRVRLDSGEITHLSLFAFAPQPLLILIGSRSMRASWSVFHCFTSWTLYLCPSLSSSVFVWQPRYSGTTGFDWRVASKPAAARAGALMQSPVTPPNPPQNDLQDAL